MSELKYHWYLVAGRSIEGTHNKPFGLSAQNITKKTISWFKKAMVEQSIQNGLSCHGLVITNISYLGEMTEAEFLEGDA